MDGRPSAWLSAPGRKSFIALAAILVVVLSVLFYGAFLPGHTVFANDSPVGVQMHVYEGLPKAFASEWQDLNSIGFRGAALLSTAFTLLWVLGPIGFSKFFAPIGLFILGVAAWTFFRRLRLTPLACVLGGIAAAMNAIFFSTASWGLAGHPITAAACYFALALLADPSPRRLGIRVPLAGMCIGVGLTDGADIGAIFSLLFAACVFYRWAVADGPRAANLGRGVARVGIAALFAALFAAQSIDVLVSTQGVAAAGMQQTRSRLEQWDWATQWSLPKREALSILIPGLFGYRMDTPQGLTQGLHEHYSGGEYWGAAGRDPNWDRFFSAAEGGKLQPGNAIAVNFPGAPNLNVSQQIGGDGKITLSGGGEIKAAGLTVAELEQDLMTLYASKLPEKQVNVVVQQPGGFMRYSGGGPYAGVLVVLVALWAAAQALRRDSMFAPEQRRMLWFWTAAAILALLFAFGRHAPFYQFLYLLPYFSSIRNPAKFLYVFSFALVVLFAYGMDGLSRRSMGWGSAYGSSLQGTFKTWWAKATQFDRRWVKGCLIAVGLSLVCWFIYLKSQPALEAYLQKVQFDETMARATASFSIKEAGWFVFYLILSAGLFILVLSGRFSGTRAKWGAVLMGTLLIVDLGRANIPWILFVDYGYKNATNPVVDQLKQQPFEHRVALLPFRTPPQYERLGQLYRIEWAQHHFQYYDIQSLDVVQMPRTPEDLDAYERALTIDGSTNGIHHVTRRWELTNTRYLLGAAPMLDILNAQLDPAKRRFKIATRFNIEPKPGVDARMLDDLTAVTAPDGQYALFDFTGALPRAKLYMNWQAGTNDAATLNQISNPEFDPEQTVLVAKNILSVSAGTNSGQVKFVTYERTHLVFETQAAAPAVLLLNDHYDPNWKVTVDGKAADLLRCNFIMRGVQVPAGQHRVEFSFKPPVKGLYVSLGAVALGILLVGMLVAGVGKGREDGGQRTEDGGRRTENREQKTDGSSKPQAPSSREAPSSKPQAPRKAQASTK